MRLGYNRLVCHVLVAALLSGAAAESRAAARPFQQPAAAFCPVQAVPPLNATCAVREPAILPAPALPVTAGRRGKLPFGFPSQDLQSPETVQQMVDAWLRDAGLEKRRKQGEQLLPPAPTSLQTRYAISGCAILLFSMTLIFAVAHCSLPMPPAAPIPPAAPNPQAWLAAAAA